jgi:methyl-accepting chemotaxis protein
MHVRHSVITKVVIATVLVLTAILLVAYYRVSVVGSKDTKARQLTADSLEALHELQGAGFTLTRIKVDIRDAILDPQRFTFYESRILTQTEYLTNHVARLGEHVLTPEVTALISTLQSELAAFHDLGGRILAYGRARNMRAATTLLLAEYIPAGESILESLQLIEGQYKHASAVALASLRTSAATANRMTYLNVVFSSLAALGVIVYIYASVVRPVIRIKNEVGRLAAGDLTSAYQALSDRGEIGDLSRSLCATITNLRALVSSVQTASQSVAASALGLSGSIKEVAAGNDNQVGITKEISQTIEHLAGATQEIAANAQNAAAAGATAREVAQAGTLKIGKAIDTLKTVQESVLSLSSVSNQIGGMAAVIGDIADQTNLLSLNAAIEAARAGEHGRSFAVVADAVRSLAEQSRRSTKEIKDLTSTVLKQIDAAIALSTEGAEGATGAQAALTGIITNINDIALTIEGISAASEEQAAAANEVAASMDNFGSITNQVAASSHETSLAAQQLSALADELRQTADQFRL